MAFFVLESELYCWRLAIHVIVNLFAPVFAQKEPCVNVYGGLPTEHFYCNAEICVFGLCVV